MRKKKRGTGKWFEGQHRAARVKRFYARHVDPKARAKKTRVRKIAKASRVANKRR